MNVGSVATASTAHDTADPATGRGRPGTGGAGTWPRRLLMAARGLLVIVVAVVVWQVVVDTGVVSAHFLASPSSIVASLAHGFSSGTVTSDLGVSLYRVGIGWLIGCVLGYIVGMAIGSLHWLHELFNPILEFIRPVSPVALIPVAILLLGIGNASKFAIVGFACFWPVLLNTVGGVQSISQHHRRIGKALGFSRREEIVHVLLPGSLPDAFVGLRLAAGIAFVVIVAAEFVGATNGLGYLILSAEQSFNTPLMYGAIVLLAFLGWMANLILVGIERSLIRWRV